MTPTQYRAALERLGLTQDSAAAFLGKSLRTSNGYANGQRIPKETSMLLRAMVKYDLEPEDVE